ncbi:Aste57867_23365 [Aphanomyces stellatus]|uniref:Aste57867_23365 protein n=1 Tax=Aphanomyces stellatus TaxID=120398 RepID=A0A485LMK3_9STRA|nr:hypothetical protein As57867_023294 [Aphanomyces stellatus]VFU00011.1 Aste57867_23365 [Aphanomyces stellatus]
MGAESMLEDEAREDWISRGFAMKDFSMKKMTAIWDKEDEEEINREKKKKLIQHKHKPLAEDIKGVLSKVQAEVASLSAGVKETLKQYEPVILRDRRWLREHISLVHRMDEECVKYKQLKLQSHSAYIKTSKEDEAKSEERHARIEHKAPLLRRLREMKDEADRRDRADATAELEARCVTRQS